MTTETQTQSSTPTITPSQAGGVTATFSLPPNDNARQATQTATQKAADNQRPADTKSEAAPAKSESHLSKEQEAALYDDEDGDQGEGQPELIMGRYKDTAELVEAYKNLQRKKGIDVPASYDLSDAGLKDTGITGLNQSDPFYSEIQTDLRSANVTADQLPALAKIMSKWQRTQAAKNGPTTDLKAEEKLLRKEWGDTYDTRGQEVAEWAKENVNPGVWQSLAKTAEGMKFLESIYRKAERGSTPITGQSTKATVTRADLELELGRLRADPAYYQNSREGKAIHEKADKIYARLAKMK